ncbi:MAG TPA: carboxypeptidase-like regulatory domain-containing protein [Candidatus Kapabacteria bacterium]|nr:carboxypeptidase-like regulatory domain-containing protein [Candidatus Kapabacteria bacterium]
MKTLTIIWANHAMRVGTILILLFVGGCKDSSTTVVNSGSDVTGTLKGLIVLYDSSGQLVSDKSGVRIELVGTNFSAVTDTGGLWMIENLPSRTYDLKFSKPGYGTLLSQFQFLGGSTLWFTTTDYPFTMEQPPTFAVILDAVISPTVPIKDSFGLFHNQNGVIYYHYPINTPTNTYIGNILISSRNPNLDLSDPSSYQQIYLPNRFYKYAADTVISGEVTLFYNAELLSGFASGETVYFRAYPYIYQLLYYYDMKTYTRVYASYGKSSNVLSITMP